MIAKAVVMVRTSCPLLDLVAILFLLVVLLFSTVVINGLTVEVDPVGSEVLLLVVL